MKRLYLLIIIYCVHIHSYAQEYQITEVEEIACSFFNASQQYAPGIDGNHSKKQISSIAAISRDSTNYMYLANTIDSAGWVVISNEKAYPTIIAHCDSGNFTYNRDFLPPAFLYLLEQHMNAIDSTRANNLSNIDSIDEYTSSAVNTNYTSPVFLKDNCWMQDENNGVLDCDRVYNKFVPASHNVTCGRTLVGCGAVAMAQIMKYWKWPDYAFIKDTIIGGKCHGNLNQRFYDWDKMPDRINENTDIYLVDAVAGLLRDCAYAASTVFHGNAGSSALIKDINSALQDVFGFHTNREHEFAWTEMEPILCQEINDYRPVLCQAWKTTLIPDPNGVHSFVITGYKRIALSNDKTETQYHINWGWGSGYNAYVNLDFNGYDGNRTFLTEIYPLCNLRANDVSLNNTFTIAAGDNRTYYSTNNVTVCSNNNTINVNNGGHLLVKAGNNIYIKHGFHANTGSNVHLKIDPLCNTTTTTSTSTPQRVAPKTSSDDTYSTDETSTYNSMENIETENIISTSIYTISGQLIQTIAGDQHDATHLPNGMYILQHRMSDGSMRTEKIARN